MPRSRSQSTNRPGRRHLLVLADQYRLHTTSIDKQEADEPLLTPASRLTALNAGTVTIPLGPKRLFTAPK
jgi:hypothetical protein